ncbi:hypothetical protein HDU76_001920 [Blyttiomyces sp. JEL0837]|nr:hypothetical protein HDU76_001920 [Blyttiomyces sp. JEL0837]
MSYNSRSQSQPRQYDDGYGSRGGNDYRQDNRYDNSRGGYNDQQAGYRQQSSSRYDDGGRSNGYGGNSGSYGGNSGSRYNDQSSYGGGSNSNGGGGGSKWAAAAAAAEDQSRTGYKPYQGWETVDDEAENYEDEGWLARKTRKTQNDSVETTRRALAKMHEADDIASKSLGKLNSQSEQLYNIEHRLNVAHGHAKVSEAKASELRSLNRFFMLPTFTSKNKTKRIEDKMKREMDEAELKEQERKERMQEALQRGGSGSSGYYGSEPDLHERSSSGSGGGMGWGRSSKGKESQPKDSVPSYGNYKSYSTPDGLERDELEEEIDNNLDQMSAGLQKLRMMGQLMNSELESQNSHIRRIGDKTTEVKETVDKVNKQVNRVMKKK